MTVGIAGLGLIGGSMAKAVKARTDCRVLGFDRDGAVLKKALRDGACDGVLDGNSVQTCDIVLVALWPDATVEFVTKHAGSFAPGSLVSDLCGIKGRVCDRVREAAAGRDFTFIGSHPMAGREHSGYDSSLPDLFVGASVLLTPFPGTDRAKIDALAVFYRSLGFSQAVETTPEEHDRIIAYTSQLAHVVSNAYVKSPTAALHHGFSAGSYRDLTRVARLNEDMWTELFLENRAPLKAEVDGLIERLTRYSAALGENDAAALHDLLKEGREIKERIDAEND